jgi:predicted anti-sigma-YlaC factor YlaD
VTCGWCEERFERFLDGDLDRTDHARLIAHVDACADCRSLLEELRVVDALLLQPRAIEPEPNFTFKTMADVRTLPPPAAAPSQLPAYLVCYVVATWLLIGAGFVLASHTMHAFGETALDVARTVVVAFGGVLHVASHLGDRGELSSWSTVAGEIVIVDLMLVAVLVAGARFAAPWLAERQRS